MQLRTILTPIVIASSLFLVACDKKAEVAAPAAPEASVTAPAPVAKQPAAAAPVTPKAAEFNPDLKPSNVVWDSPDKKKAWEARQRAKKAKQAEMDQSK